MSRVPHIAAAAHQLTRALFNDKYFEGSVLVGEQTLEVAVHGKWTGAKLKSFAGYDVTWREAA